MAQFATILSGKIALALDLFDSGTKRPRVRDKTGLTGKYNFILEFSCDGCVGPGNMATRRGFVEPPQGDVPAAASDQSGGGLPTIFTAVEKQLGLRLEKVKDVPLDVIVIDHVDKVPTENQSILQYGAPERALGRRLDPYTYANDPLLAERIHAALVSGVEQVEMELRRKVDESGGNGSVRSPGGETVPQGYADAVAEYFRKLSKSK